MAEQAVSAVASAVIGGITERALTTVMQKLRPGSRPAAAHEKLQRLETLVLKLRCAVEVSEKHAIECDSLLKLREELREAAAEGGAVVLDFQRRAREAEAAAAATSAAGQQQPAAGGALYFTRSALSGMAQRVRDATRRLFATDEDMQKLDSVLEKMEELSPDITLFATLLQLEVASPKKPSAKRRAAPESPSARKEPKFRSLEKEARTLQEMSQRIGSCINAMDGKDMGGLEWLPQWVAIVREAADPEAAGRGMLGTGDALDADGHLYGFVHAVGLLARDEACFAILVSLCPTKKH